MENKDVAICAIEFSLRTKDGLKFLGRWMDNDFDSIRDEWPECPISCFYDAEPNGLPILKSLPIILKAQDIARLLAPLLGTTEGSIKRDISRNPNKFPSPSKVSSSGRKEWKTYDVYRWVDKLIK